MSQPPSSYVPTSVHKEDGTVVLDNEVFGGYSGLEAIHQADASVHSCMTMYCTSCRELSIKPNTVISQYLPKVPGTFDMKELNISNNFIGDKGLESLLDVVEANKRMCRMRVSDNGLKNGSVLKLLKVARDHPALISLDLSGNKFLSLEVGTMCLQLVRQKPNFMHLSLTRTSVSKKLQDTIEVQLKQNRRKNGEKNRLALEGRVRIEKAALFEAKELFDGIDRSGTGRVTMSGLTQVAKDRGLTELSFGGMDAAVFSTVDKDGDGTVTLVEYLRIAFPKAPEEDILYWINCYSDFVYSSYTPPPEISAEQLEEIKEIFASFDKSGDGVLSKAELRESLKNCCYCMDVDSYFMEADSSGDGVVDLGEFVKVMTPYYLGNVAG